MNWSLSASLHYVYLPFLLVVRILLAVVTTIATPLIHIGSFILQPLWWPFKLFNKFETLLIYFGIAMLVGIGVGGILHYVVKFCTAAIGSEPVERETGRTLASYRAEKALKADKAKKVEKEARRAWNSSMLLESPKINSTMNDDWFSDDRRSVRTRDLLSTTILEEDDSSDAGFG